MSSLRRGGRIGKSSNLLGGLVVALWLGVAAATGHGVAWADGIGGDSPGGANGPSGATTGKGASTGNSPASGAPTDSTNPRSALAARGGPAGTPTPSTNGSGRAKTALIHVDPPATGGNGLRDSASARGGDPSASSARTRPAIASTLAAEPGSAGPQQLSPAANPALSVVAGATAPEPSPNSPSSTSTAPRTPAAVSAVAATLAVPARIANELFGLIGLITGAGTTPGPITPDPLFDLLFAVARRLESATGLDTPLTGQPVLASQAFTGSVTTTTPTVAQFLNAATAGYVLGGVPSGLTPFVVDGFPVTYANVFSGAAAQVFVTPQDQIIIAYQGTGGGTNLLVNPLIVVAQVLTDALAIFTNTTPTAFDDALRFARLVQDEAARQGFAPNSVFVTGHSLGGWEAQYVAQNTGLAGIGFESPGLSTIVAGNGADSLFVNVATYGDPASLIATDLPGLQPFAPPYVAGGGIKPHYGPIVLLGDPNSRTPLTNAASLLGTSVVGDLVFVVVLLLQLSEHHLPDNQAYSLDVDPDPGFVTGLGLDSGPVYTGFGDLSIPEFLQAASAAGILITP